MNMLNINGNNRFDKIAQPKLPTTDLNDETELKGALEPLFAEVLDELESAGWERRKAAYVVMVLAAEQLSHKGRNR
jgi:hypothetical protein